MSNEQGLESVGFDSLPLSQSVRKAVGELGYTNPTSIQSQIIPFMIAGRDVLAQSQTGSGKTAAFALPILSQLNTKARQPQILVLVPTRELAIQVSESFNKYARHVDRFRIATIYGGQSYDPQVRQLRNGAQVVVGTPGRVIDHIKRGTLELGGIQTFVLDEADEMLNMGFIEDVEFILDQAPNERRVALFSATLPPEIQKISESYLNDPATIKVTRKTATAEGIRQRAVFVAPRDKVWALGRILEAEQTDGVIVFTKTRATTVTVAERLCRDGLSAVALNGEMPQAARERTIARFKDGMVNVLVATDVAARGLDVSRVSHVINFDPPRDAEAYIHRVGRTGRAGRNGDAIILLTNAQRRLVKSIERATKRDLEIAQVPTAETINENRVQQFKAEDHANHRRPGSDSVQEAHSGIRRGERQADGDDRRRAGSHRSGRPTVFGNGFAASKKRSRNATRTTTAVTPEMIVPKMANTDVHSASPSQAWSDSGLQSEDATGSDLATWLAQLPTKRGSKESLSDPFGFTIDLRPWTSPEGMPNDIYQRLNQQTQILGKPLRLRRELPGEEHKKRRAPGSAKRSHSHTAPKSRKGGPPRKGKKRKSVASKS